MSGGINTKLSVESITQTSNTTVNAIEDLVKTLNESIVHLEDLSQAYAGGEGSTSYELYDKLNGAIKSYYQALLLCSNMSQTLYNYGMDMIGSSRDWTSTSKTISGKADTIINGTAAFVGGGALITTAKNIAGKINNKYGYNENRTSNVGGINDAFNNHSSREGSNSSQKYSNYDSNWVVSHISTTKNDAINGNFVPKEKIDNRVFENINNIHLEPDSNTNTTLVYIDYGDGRGPVPSGYTPGLFDDNSLK